MNSLLSYSLGSLVLPNLLPSFRLFFIALSRGDLFILSLLTLFVNPFFRFLLFLHFISLFLSLFVHFAWFFPLIQKVTTERRSIVTLNCLLYLDKKINSQNKSSVSYWRRHPDLNWGSRCCRPMPYHLAIAPYWSGLRGSNSLPPPWQGGALPDELNPHLVLPDGIEPSTRGFSVLCSTDWATEAKQWRPEWGSNPRPLAWQASVLTSWTTRPYERTHKVRLVGTTGLEPVTLCL